MAGRRTAKRSRKSQRRNTRSTRRKNQRGGYKVGFYCTSDDSCLRDDGGRTGLICDKTINQCKKA